MGETIKRITMLDEIGDCFQQVMQWAEVKDNSNWADIISRNLHRAEVLIELLEVEDCGSIGGFDKGQTHTNKLFERWVWLYCKYNNPARKRFGCNIVSFKEIKDYFKES